MKRILLLLVVYFFLATPSFAREYPRVPFVNLTPTLGVTTSPKPEKNKTVVYELPFPGILPDHPFYILKVIRDHVILFFAKDPEKNVNLNIMMANKRLVMGQELIARKKELLGARTISKGEKYLLKTIGNLREMQKKGRHPSVGLVNNIGTAIAKHKEIITKLRDQTTGEAQGSMGLSLQLVEDAEKQLELFKKQENIAM